MKQTIIIRGRNCGRTHAQRYARLLAWARGEELRKATLALNDSITGYVRMITHLEIQVQQLYYYRQRFVIWAGLAPIIDGIRRRFYQRRTRRHVAQIKKNLKALKRGIGEDLIEAIEQLIGAGYVAKLKDWTEIITIELLGGPPIEPKDFEGQNIREPNE